MIFLSHNWQDKHLVEPFARALADRFGQSDVFYDSWSIQPGDGIIDKMNAGLSSAKFLLLFVSRNSLSSQMVSLEWQNALYSAVRGTLRFIPIRLDSSPLPAVFIQTLYIDLPNLGLDVAIRQAVDVVSGASTFRPSTAQFENVRAYGTRDGKVATIEIRAESYMEPQSRYLFLFHPGAAAPAHQVLTDMMVEAGYQADVTFDNGKNYGVQLIAVSRPTSVGFPVTVRLDDTKSFVGILRAVSHKNFEPVPLVWQPS